MTSAVSTSISGESFSTCPGCEIGVWLYQVRSSDCLQRPEQWSARIDNGMLGCENAVKFYRTLVVEYLLRGGTTAETRLQSCHPKQESAMSDDNWYRAALYEQSWENYRNEDENFRGTIWQYLVFVAAIVYAASQARDATRFIGVLGLFISVVTGFYSLRINLYSYRWLLAKDTALPDGKSETEHLTEAKREHPCAFIPGWLLALAFPIGGTVLFGWMAYKGTAFWTP